ncbi:MAG TPA: TIGR02266 family protein [Polyangia bacterium]
MADNDKRGTDRTPAALRIRLRYPDVDTFVDRYATNVSKGGIFIASRTPKPVGAAVRFEFQLADGSPVVKGEGKVVWVKEFDPEHPQKPHGMGLKFTRLDTASKALLDRMVAHRQELTSPDAGQRPGEGSGVLPEPRYGSGALPVGLATAMQAVITEGSGPVGEGSGMRPLPPEGSGATAAPPPPAAATPPPPAATAPPRATATAPRPPRPRGANGRALTAARMPAGVAELPAVRDLEALAVELGFTDAMLAHALARARELSHTADAEPALAGLWGAPLEPGSADAARPGTGRHHLPDGDESTDVERDAAPERRAPAAEFALSDPLHAGPMPVEEPAGEPPRGGLLSSVKKLFGK